MWPPWYFFALFFWPRLLLLQQALVVALQLVELRTDLRDLLLTALPLLWLGGAVARQGMVPWEIILKNTSR